MLGGRGNSLLEGADWRPERDTSGRRSSSAPPSNPSPTSSRPTPLAPSEKDGSVDIRPPPISGGFRRRPGGEGREPKKTGGGGGSGGRPLLLSLWASAAVCVASRSNTVCRPDLACSSSSSGHSQSVRWEAGGESELPVLWEEGVLTVSVVGIGVMGGYGGGWRAAGRSSLKASDRWLLRAAHERLRKQFVNNGYSCI